MSEYQDMGLCSKRYRAARRVSQEYTNRHAARSSSRRSPQPLVEIQARAPAVWFRVSGLMSDGSYNSVVMDSSSAE